MNLELARSRINDVIRPDATTESYSDFLMTHVPLKKLQILKKFETIPSERKYKTEDEIFKELIKNEDNKHQFIIVYGQSGTGKSHLIRYFQTKLEQLNLDNEVIIFIRRSDNTLKGTIRQLLNKPEIAEMKDKDIYDRLANASAVVSEDVLKDNIYHKFIIAIEQDSDDMYEIQLPNQRKKQLVSFLNNELVKEKIMSSDGPIERIYSKVAESKVLVDRDVVAEFRKEDFYFDDDLIENLLSEGADKKAVKLARRLLEDEEGVEFSKEISKYLNQFIDSVIQECAGLQSGDFKQIFTGIREELHTQGKNLTLFIEDITSFTGVDSALLNALMEENTGMYENLCRVSSIIGTTSNYFENNFKDNHKDRVTSFVYIPQDAFGDDGIYEFVGKYINAMSLEQPKINEWIKEGALMDQYPVHDVVEGKYWDFVNIQDGKKLCLYPFTKNAIKKLYNEFLKEGHKTPRYLLKDIMEPVIRDILDSKSTFPKDRFSTVRDTDLTMRLIASNQVSGEDLERVLRFMYIWGNGKSEKTNTTIAGLKVEIYDELSLPKINFKESDVEPAPTPEDEPTIPTPDPVKPDVPVISEEKKAKINGAMNLFTKWINGEIKFDASISTGDASRINAARTELGKFVLSAIDWQCEGVSLEIVKKIDAKSVFAFENQLRYGNYLYKLPCNTETELLVMAFVKWRVLGDGSWDYSDSYKDIFYVTEWLSTNKKDIIILVKNTHEGKERTVIEAAIASEIIRSILNGEYKVKELYDYNIEKLFSVSDPLNFKATHSKEWNAALSQISKTSKGTKDFVNGYYNLKQGSGGGKIVLQANVLEPTFKRVKRSICSIETYEDSIKQFKDILNTYSDVVSKLETVAASEKEKAKEDLELIKSNLDVNDLDEELNDLFDIVTEYFKEGAKTSIHMQFVELDLLKQKKKAVKDALNRLLQAEKEQDYFEVLLLFSSDPLSTIKPLVDVINALNKRINDMSLKIAAKKEALGGNDTLGDASSYTEEKQWIKESNEILEFLNDGGTADDN